VDVDLRQLNEVAKKRTSTENLESGQNKKSKSEVFDAYVFAAGACGCE
jgi:hypothetical protein